MGVATEAATMTTTMMLEDDNEWPSLTNSGGPRSAIIPPTSTDGNEEEWELLVEAAAEVAEGVDAASPLPSQVLAVDGIQLSISKSIRHAMSSPNLCAMSSFPDDVSSWTLGQSPTPDEAASMSSYSLLSRPATVISLASTERSFRDAILSSLPQSGTDAAEPTLHTSTRDSSASLLISPKRNTSRSKPRIVVKPIQRCARSTGDLQSLMAIPEVEHDEEGQNQVLGETDAGEFYHQKSLGARGHVNGKKLRPDEAKRKEMAIYKRNLQRDANKVGRKAEAQPEDED